MLRIPRVFGGNTLYATCALVASTDMVWLYKAHHPTVGVVAAIITGAGLCLLARQRAGSCPRGRH